MTDNRKNIKLDPNLFARLKDAKPDHMNWPTFLEQRCLETGGVNVTATVTPELDEDAVDDIRERLEEVSAEAVATGAVRGAERWEDCDECGTGGGGLCPACNAEAEVRGRD